MHNSNELLGNRYKKVKKIGKGSYGSVYEYVDTRTGERVAIKKLQEIQDISDAKRVLREIMILKACHHDNLLELKGFHLEPQGKFYEVYLVTELMDFDLYRVIKKGRDEMTGEHIQYVMYQIFLGLFYLHENNVIHRDIKPNNILLNDSCDVKICDFGFAREIIHGNSADNTEYVVTRYYRAPEIMLNSRKYNSAVDIWSVGCTFFELIDSRILFGEANNYIALLEMIIQMLGTPSTETLNFIENENAINWIKTQKPAPSRKASEYLKNKNISAEALDLLDRCLVFDPRHRISAKQALEHPYFQDLFEAENDLNIMKLEFDFNFEKNPKLTMEELKTRLFKEVMNYQSQ
jgi:mitogen-activated protein kinase 1/3